MPESGEQSAYGTARRLAAVWCWDWDGRSHRRVASSLQARDKISRLGICAGRTGINDRLDAFVLVFHGRVAKTKLEAYFP